MGDATQTGSRVDAAGVGNFIVYADFNCPFSYALNERIHALGLESRVDFRHVRHAPLTSSAEQGCEVLSRLSGEVAELRRRAPSIAINLPLFRPDSGPATALVGAVSRKNPLKGNRLRRRIYRALWIDGEDISQPEILAALLAELRIDRPAEDRGLADEILSWQQQWDRNPEYDGNIPVIVCEPGDTVIGFPLEPELDAFLHTGSLVADDVFPASGEPPDIQRILMLDRDAASLRMVIEQMRDAQVEVFTEFSALVAAAIKHGMPDMVLVNTGLIGDIERSDWWRDATDTDLETAVPVIFVADTGTIDAEVAAFEAGAADFIAKPFHPKVLRARLNMHLQARRSQQQLNNIARVDALTSVCNRREFDLRLMTEWGRAARAGKSLGLLMIDVDKFKEYNDHYGHLRGDDCLATVARLLVGCMHRSGDFIARYGGEEFVALLPEVDLEGAMKVARACLEAVSGALLPHITSNVSRYVTVSIGVATMVPIYDRSSTLLIEQADIALYQAKQLGRNQVCSFAD